MLTLPNQLVNSLCFRCTSDLGIGKATGRGDNYHEKNLDDSYQLSVRSDVSSMYEPAAIFSLYNLFHVGFFELEPELQHKFFS